MGHTLLQWYDMHAGCLVDGCGAMRLTLPSCIHGSGPFWGSLEGRVCEMHRTVVSGAANHNEAESVVVRAIGLAPPAEGAIRCSKGNTVM